VPLVSWLVSSFLPWPVSWPVSFAVSFDVSFTVVSSLLIDERTRRHPP
jgi:hypothetical protein